MRSQLFEQLERVLKQDERRAVHRRDARLVHGLLSLPLPEGEREGVGAGGLLRNRIVELMTSRSYAGIY